MVEKFIIHRDGTDIQIREWIFNTINNREEFPSNFILTFDLFEFTSIELQKAFINDVNSIVDYRYYIKVLIQNHIKNDIDEFKRLIVMSWYNMSYLYPTAQLIYNTTKLPLNDIKRILNELSTYLEFKKKPKQKDFRMVTAEYPDNAWQADLIDFSQAQTPFYKDGDGNQYLASELKESDIVDHQLKRVMISDYNECSYALVLIDVFSRYVWVRNLINNTAFYVSEAFQSIVMENGKLTNILQRFRESLYK
jgi:hypothetical protein